MVQKTDRLVTLFGGGGFVGRYVAQALYRSGARLRIAQREPRRAFFLKPLGGVGQSQFVRADVTDPESVARAVEGAEAAAAAGARALVHVSAIGADPESRSAYGRSKGEGEAAVRAAFPAATIVRPSIVAGVEDRFINRFAQMARYLPFIPVIRGPVRFQPVLAADVGRAIAAAALDALAFGGRSYELGGPQVLTMRELNEWVAEQTGRSGKPIVDIPDAAARMMARLGGWLPGAPMTWDQWLMLQSDNVVAEDAAGFEAFGIRPAPLAALAEGWLTPYRRGGRFAAKSPY